MMLFASVVLQPSSRIHAHDPDLADDATVRVCVQVDGDQPGMFMQLIGEPGDIQRLGYQLVAAARAGRAAESRLLLERAQEIADP